MVEHIIKKVTNTSENLNDTTDLIRNLGADSVDRMEIFMAIEDAYDIFIPDDEFRSIDTIGDIKELLKNKGVDL